MSETPDDANPFAAVAWPESYPDACQSEDNGAPAITTLPEPTPAEKAVSGAKRAREAMNQWAKDYGEAARKAEDRTPTNLSEVMRACNKADDEAHATGTEALVCADIAKRQREGIAKYGMTVANNPLSLLAWLQHFYEEILDAAIYAKRSMEDLKNKTHDNQNENQSDGGAAGVLPDSSTPVHRHRKPGAGRKAKPCPGCGATKSIGSTVKNGIPTRRCRQCGHVVQTYPHLANGKTAE